MMQNDKLQINIVEIMEMLPHRYPFLLVDKIINIEENKSIVGIKNVTVNEPQFMGHFVNDPIMPGVLLIEAMAQVSAVLVASSMPGSKAQKAVYFMSIDHAKFRKIVRPGDTLVIKSAITQHRSYIWQFKATAEVDGQVVAESEFKAMVKDREEQ